MTNLKGVFLLKNYKKLNCFIIVFALILQTFAVSSVFAGEFIITKFTQSPKTPVVNETVLFRVRTEGTVENVKMSIDGEKEFNLNRKSNNIWEVEKKFSIIGTRYIKVIAIGKNGDRVSINDTIEVISKDNTSNKSQKEETTETTTEKTYTGNVTKTTEVETTTETTTIKIVGADDFDGKEYNETCNISDTYFDLSQNEDVKKLDEISANSIFMFVGENTFINKWAKKPIDDTNKNVTSYIKNGYTLVPLRAISEAFNADVSWDENKRVATISLNGKVIQIPVGYYVIKVSDKNLSIDAPAEIKEGRVFVPLRVVAECLDKNVYYKDKFIAITNKEHTLSNDAMFLIRDAVLRLK